MKKLFLLLFLPGCGTMSLDERGRNVMIVDTFAASDEAAWEYTGHLLSGGMYSEEYCRNDLRNRAAGDGAQVVRITRREADWCGLDGITDRSKPKNCFLMEADAFRRRAN